MTHHVSGHHYDTLIIGGGQAGLAMGYYLAQQHRDFVILDAGTRGGDAWRSRWNTLRLFSPAAYSQLPGLRFPASASSFPTKDQMADYLATYAATFDLPVCFGQYVDALTHDGDHYVVTAGHEQYRVDQVVVATGPYHTPRVPGFAAYLEPAIIQLHSSAYRTPAQLPEGDVLVVGAGNSGAEIARELATTHRTYLSGRDTGHVPAGLFRRRLFWWLLNRIPVDTTTKRGRMLHGYNRRRGDPLFRLTSKDLRSAGVQRVPRTEGVIGGQPTLADGRVLHVRSVVWATGFQPDFGWIKLPIFDRDGYPRHVRGVIRAMPGLYVLGLPFQHTLASATIGGVGKDARYLSQCMMATNTAHRPLLYPKGVPPEEK